MLLRQRGLAAPAARRRRARGRLLPARRRAHVGHRVDTRASTTSSRGSSEHPEDADRFGPTACSCSAARTRRCGSSRRRRLAMRWALADVDARVRPPRSPKGAKVVIDLMRRQPRPVRVRRRRRTSSTRTVMLPPSAAAPTGCRSASGMHACIGEDLAAGLVYDRTQRSTSTSSASCPMAVQAMFDQRRATRSRRSAGDGHDRPLGRTSVATRCSSRGRDNVSDASERAPASDRPKRSAWPGNAMMAIHITGGTLIDGSGARPSPASTS